MIPINLERNQQFFTPDRSQPQVGLEKSPAGRRSTLVRVSRVVLCTGRLFAGRPTGRLFGRPGRPGPITNLGRVRVRPSRPAGRWAVRPIPAGRPTFLDFPKFVYFSKNSKNLENIFQKIFHKFSKIFSIFQKFLKGFPKIFQKMPIIFQKFSKHFPKF